MDVKSKTTTICSLSEIQFYRDKVLNNMEKSKQSIKTIVEKEDALSFFKNVKYNKIVNDSLTEDAENFIEIVNQDQTYLVSLKSAEYLKKRFPDKCFIINFGNVSGYDIVSTDGRIIAECFAATSYRSNSKLLKDLKRLSKSEDVDYKFEFFYDLEFGEKSKAYYEKKYPDIEIIHFSDVV